MNCLRALILLFALARADYFQYEPSQQYGADTYGLETYGDDLAYGSDYQPSGYGAEYGDDYGVDAYGGDAYGVEDFGYGGEETGYGAVEYGVPAASYGDDYGVTEVEVGYGAQPSYGEVESYGPVSYGVETTGYGPVEDSYGSWDNEYDYAPVVKKTYAPRKSGHKQVKFDDFDFYGKSVAPRKSYKQVKVDDGYGDLDFYGGDFAPVKYAKQAPAKKSVVFKRPSKVMRPLPVHSSGYDDYGYDVKKDSVHDSTEYGQSEMHGKSLYGRKYVEDGGMYEVGKIKGFGGENQDDLFEHVSKYRTGGKIDSYGEKKHKYGAFDAYGHSKKSGHNFLRRKIDIGGKMFAKGSLGAFGKAGAKGKMGMQQKFKSVVRKHKSSGPKKQQFQGYY